MNIKTCLRNYISLFSVLLLSTGVAYAQLSRTTGVKADPPGHSLIIECPASISYGIRDVPPGWSDYDARRLQFLKAYVTSSGSVRLIGCDYGQGGSQANLSRQVPQGHTCAVIGGSKSVECKPIKIGGYKGP